MKAKTLLRLVKAHCCEKNCCVGLCPMAVKAEYGCDCVLSIDYVEDWDVDDIIKRAKALKKCVKKERRK